MDSALINIQYMYIKDVVKHIMIFHFANITQTLW